MERRIFLGSFAVISGFGQDVFDLGTSPPNWQFSSQDRELALDRYARAQEFMDGLDYGAFDYVDFLYRAGIVAQLGLTAFLFSKGLDDDWCRRQMGMDVAKGLRFANHLGLNCDCPRIAALTQTLGNYGRWRRPVTVEIPMPDLLYPKPSAEDVRNLMRWVQNELKA